MKLFSRKNEDEEEYEDDPPYAKASADRSGGKRREAKQRFADEDFKDLKPENKKKREPKKPWGKKERIMVLAALLLTAGTSGVLALSARSWKLPGLPELKMPKVSLPFMGEETIVLKGSKNDQVKANKVISQFERMTQELGGVYGLYVVNLDNGFSYGVNEAEVFQAASLIKLPVVAGMYMGEEEGGISLNAKYKLKQQDKVAGSGSLYSKPVGYEITYQNLLDLMGKQSDNTAFNVSRKLLGDEKINQAIAGIGMVNTSLENNETTPRDIGTFFEGLWNGNIVSTESSKKILDSLTDTIYEDWISAGIPEGVRVAHKYGREVHVVNDAGIVYAERPFVVVIMTKGVIEREADEIFPELARIVYEGETGE